MTRFLIKLAGGLTLGAVLSACAGPDIMALDRAHKGQLATQAQTQSQRDIYANLPPTAAGSPKCPQQAPVMGLDHGPRAQTTPYQNQLRRDRYAAQVSACLDAKK